MGSHHYATTRRGFGHTTKRIIIFARGLAPSYAIVLYTAGAYIVAILKIACIYIILRWTCTCGAVQCIVRYSMNLNSARELGRSLFRVYIQFTTQK